MFKYYLKTGFYNKIEQLVLLLNYYHHYSITDYSTLKRLTEVKYLEPYRYDDYQLAKRGYVEKIAVKDNRLTVRTPENIFVAWFLEKIIRDLNYIQKVSNRLISHESEKKIDKTIKIELRCLRREALKIKRKLTTLRLTTFLAEIPSGVLGFELTMRLYENPIYNSFFNLYREYAKYLVPYDSSDEVFFWQDWLIYELFVLFNLRDVLVDLFGDYMFSFKGDIFPGESQVIKEEIPLDTARRSIFSRVWEYKWKNSVRLLYQKSFYGLTSNVRPDFTIYYNGKPIILDAKHKDFKDLQHVNEEGEAKGKTDFEQMHIYRDNIVRENAERIVDLAVLVFSGKVDEEAGKRVRKLLYKDHWDSKFLEFGIVAFNFNTQRKQKALKEFLLNIFEEIEKGGLYGG